MGAWILLALIQLYKIFLSPFFGGACKYYPSCSNYAQEAVQKHGARRGAWLAAKRLGRCRPFVKGGFDPVPERDDLVGDASLIVTELATNAVQDATSPFRTYIYVK